MRLLAIIILIMTTLQAFGQDNIEKALKLWEKGDFLQVNSITEKILQNDPDNEEARYLHMKLSFIQGKYDQSLEWFALLNESYTNYREAVDLAFETYLHLRDYKQACLVADKNNNSSSRYSLFQELKNRPFTVVADKTFIVPFLNDDQIPSLYWPGVNGTLNGIPVPIRFDTGADFLIIGKSIAEKYGVPLKYEDKGMHGTTKVTMWRAIADSLTFENGPAFLNVPVTIMESLGDYVIFGTSILEQFLTTVDYPNDRFIFTPGNKPELLAGHYLMLSSVQKTIPFFLWGDHYMIAKGSFAGRDSLNLFFDSGLIAMTEINGSLAQAPFTASRESLLEWGFDGSAMNQNAFYPTEYSIEIAGLSQPNTLVYYDNNLKKDRFFGGIRIDGLISHAWLKNYSWTIDFNKMEYSFDFLMSH